MKYEMIINILSYLNMKLAGVTKQNNEIASHGNFPSLVSFLDYKYSRIFYLSLVELAMQLRHFKST